MDLFQNQNHLTSLKNAEQNYRDHAVYYNEVADIFKTLINKLEMGIEREKRVLKDKSDNLSHKLGTQTLEQRLNFVKLNFFNEYDLQNLSSIIMKHTTNSTPTLELFPGSGQFLPYAVAAEPLYVFDRYIEICEYAAKNLNNEFYANRRLRKYANENNIFENLPANAFGLVYCFNEFFSCNEEYILRIAKQVLNLLHDGGIFVFNFLPNDQSWSQVMSLNYELSTINYKKLFKELKFMGYEIMNHQLKPLKSSFVELRKGNTNPEPRYKISGGWAEIIDN
jgi:hypothetical protein